MTARGNQSRHRFRAEPGYPQKHLARRAIHIHGKIRTVRQRPCQLWIDVEIEIAIGMVAGDLGDIEAVKAQQPIGLIEPVFALQGRAYQRQMHGGIRDR